MNQKLNREEQKLLAERLATLTRDEVNKLYKQASGLRKRLPAASNQKTKVSLDDLVLSLLKEDAPLPKRIIETREGMVTWIGTQSCRVSGIDCQLGGKRPAVGDQAVIGLTDDHQTWMVQSIRPRRTMLSRPDVGNANLERVIVANVDLIGIVVSVVAPPLHPRLIDRYLIAIQRGGAEPVLCVNKVDLLPDSTPDRPEVEPAAPRDLYMPVFDVIEEVVVESELDLLQPYADLGVPIFLCSTFSGQGMDELRAHLQGKMAAFVGHSGVGKSSLINALYPGLDLNTGNVSEGYGRGTHTTTASSLYEFPGNTRLIDTPGIRSFGLGKLDSEELKWHFPEFEGLQCRFRDCSHTHEPGCGVREAAESGEMHAARYDTYLRLLAAAE